MIYIIDIGYIIDIFVPTLSRTVLIDFFEV